MDRAVFDRMAETDQEHWWFEARREILDTFLARKADLPKDARILEVGAGTGHNFPVLEKYGRVDAVELDAPARALATQRLGRDVLDAALPELAGIADASYDLVALLDVLEHVEDDRAAFAGLARVMRPGGKLMLTVPAYQWMWSKHDEAHHHFRRYTRENLTSLAAEQGWKTRHATYFNSHLFPPIAAARILGKMTGSESADDAVPPAPVNGLLRFVFGAERAWVGRLPMPFGVSILALLERA
ncbi:class I SAM-dependent methyltransferase [Sphingomicrobium sediminis]|uniref:Class I SAM-dependent methyltransferase n=1 Tax=Sphingomicrobium sediminis TaxID=2950949 RepID=A0A9X2J261_9SPHN|nr:class I SAM-dependent methyltransferase [Sphingomicrobium sediminis]MCM8557948.1 class I SAM-dependent methyltransferase [Sphingomicrobium sediminis]